MKKKPSKVTWKEIEEVSIVKTKEPAPLKFIEERKREWIHKFTYSGAPILWANVYFNNRLKAFREEHQEFDIFLNELGILIKEENKEYYSNILKFIDGKSQTNWISTSNSLLDMFIKLYNLCLSPRQALNYIKKCYKAYRYMNKLTYQLPETYEVLIKRSNYDGKARKFINLYVSYERKDKLEAERFWFDVTIESLIINCDGWDICTRPDIDVKIKGDKELYEDALMLFEYHQNKTFLKTKIFDFVLKGLIDKGAFIYQKKKHYKCHIDGDLYKVPEKVGYHLFNKK